MCLGDNPILSGIYAVIILYRIKIRFWAPNALINSICAHDNHMNQSKIDPKPYNWRLGNLCDCFANRIWHCTYTILPPSLSHDYPNHCLYPIVRYSGYVRACVRVRLCSAAQRIVDRPAIFTKYGSVQFSAVRERAAKSACIIFVCVHHHTFQVSACNASLSHSLSWLINGWDIIAKICTILLYPDQWMDVIAKICTILLYPDQWMDVIARICMVMLYPDWSMDGHCCNDLHAVVLKVRLCTFRW